LCSDALYVRHFCQLRSVMDFLSRIRFVEETFCYGDVWSRRRFVRKRCVVCALFLSVCGASMYPYTAAIAFYLPSTEHLLN
jgi:hypothetical protein